MDEPKSTPALQVVAGGIKRNLPISLQQLLNKTFDENINAIISCGLLNKGSLMILAGPPKSYKSFIFNSFCYHLATGTPLFGVTKAVREKERTPTFLVNGSKRVLMLEQEIGEYDLQIRFRQLLATLPSPERTLCLEKIFTHSCDHSMQLDTIPGRDHIAKLIDSVSPDVVAFDPLIEFHTGDENSAQDMSRAMHGLDWLRERFEFGSMISHHTAKPQKDSDRIGPDNLRGSSAIYGKGDTFIMIRPSGKNIPKGQIRVDFTLRRGKPIHPLYLKVNTDTLKTEFCEWVIGG